MTELFYNSRFFQSRHWFQNSQAWFDQNFNLSFNKIMQLIEVSQYLFLILYSFWRLLLDRLFSYFQKFRNFIFSKPSQYSKLASFFQFWATKRYWKCTKIVKMCFSNIFFLFLNFHDVCYLSYELILLFSLKTFYLINIFHIKKSVFFFWKKNQYLMQACKFCYHETISWPIEELIRL